MSTRAAGKGRSSVRRWFLNYKRFLAILAVAWMVPCIGWREEIATQITNLHTVLAGSAYATDLAEPEHVLEYLLSQSENVALASYTTLPDGSINGEQPVTMHQVSESMPLASTMKIVILAGYVKQVRDGALDPAEAVSLEAWEQYYLPGTDGGAHRAALRRLGIQTDEKGFAADPTRSVELDTLAKAMIVQSDNAATDFLLRRIGRHVLGDIIKTAGLSDQDTPVSTTGMFLSWRNHTQPEQDTQRIGKLATLKPAEYAAEVARWTERYLDPHWREAELDWREHLSTSLMHYDALAADRLGTRGSARDYAKMMGGIARGTFISPEVSGQMGGYLDWPMQEFLSNRKHFHSFGTKGGSLPGVMTQTAYIVPREGDFELQTRIVVLFLRQIPVAAQVRLQRTFGHQAFVVRLATDAAFAEQVQRAFD